MSEGEGEAEERVNEKESGKEAQEEKKRNYQER